VSELAGLSSKKIRVDTRQVRRLRFLVEKASRGIHSDGRMHREDKKMILGLLAVVKRDMDAWLQLEMFPQEQLE
jgi:hypothetical protein